MTTPKKPAAELAVKKPVAVAAADQYEFDDAKVALMKRTICEKATNDEMLMFIGQCKRTKLDPFSRQIYFIKGNDGRVITQTAIDGFRVIAQRSGEYAGQDEPVFEYEHDGKTIKKCSVTIYKWHGNERYAAAVGVAHFKEFVRATQTWRDKPHVMISKVAEAIALRKAFPNDLSGLYTADEVDDGQPRAEAPRATVAVEEEPRAEYQEAQVEERQYREPPDFLKPEGQQEADITVEPIEEAPEVAAMATAAQIITAKATWKAVSVMKRWSQPVEAANLKATLHKKYGVTEIRQLTTEQAADFMACCRAISSGQPKQDLGQDDGTCGDCGRKCEGKDAEARAATGWCVECVNKHSV